MYAGLLNVALYALTQNNRYQDLVVNMYCPSQILILKENASVTLMLTLSNQQHNRVLQSISFLTKDQLSAKIFMVKIFP